MQGFCPVSYTHLDVYKRQEYLEGQGYDAQILEFIDMEHTPKNILIRAVKSGKQRENGEKLRACEEFLHIEPTLKRLLEEKEV